MEESMVRSSAEILEELFERRPELRACEGGVRAALREMLACWRTGNKLMACGNGGSAADSEHVVGELMKSFLFRRPVSAAFRERYRSVNGASVPEWLEGALPAVSLVSQVGLMTAFSNDESAVGVFAQQVYGYGQPGDVLLAISTSGSSPNVVAAARVARAMGVRVVSLTGARESALSVLSDVCVRVPETETFRVQELHLPVYHALCLAVEAEFYGGVQ